MVSIRNPDEECRQLNELLKDSPYMLEIIDDSMVICGSDRHTAAPAAVIPRDAVEYIHENGSRDAAIYVTAFCDGRYLPPVEYRGNITRFNEVYKSWGVNNFPIMNSKEHNAVIQVFSILARSLKSRTVYDFCGGWLDAQTLLINNLLVRADSVSEAESSRKVRNLEYTPMNLDAALMFLREHYIPAINNGLYSTTMLMFLLLGILYPMIAKHSEMRPSFVLYIYGTTGTRKTSSAVSMLNPFKEETCSFEDSKAAVTEQLRSIPLGCCIIDDLKTMTRDALGIINKVVRVAGDSTTSSKKMRGGKVVTKDATCLCVVTAEEKPAALQESSIARLLMLEYDTGTVNLDKLDFLTSHQTEFRSAVIAVLQEIISEEGYIEKLCSDCRDRRRELTRKYSDKPIHGRYIDMISWLCAVYKLIEKTPQNEEITLYPKYEEEIEALIVKQCREWHKDPVTIFGTGLFALHDANELKLISEADFASGKKGDIIDMGSEWFILSGTVFSKLKSCNTAINFDEKALRKALSDKGILVQHNGKNTMEYRKNGHRCSGYRIRVNILKNYLNK